MFLDGQIKLSRIFDHNFDKGTDRLYEPLRIAVETLPTAPSTSNQLQPSSQSVAAAEMRCSKINISRAQQDIIKNSTFIPINKKLVQTNNPEKRIKARSRSYRTLSVEQRIGSPMPHPLFKQSTANRTNKVEIVYDYDTSMNQKFANIAKPTEYYGAVTPSTMPRTRSATYVGVFESMMTRTERAETRVVKVQRKPSAHSGHSATSIQLKQGKNTTKNSQQINTSGGQYYQNCKKYAFRNDMKCKTTKRLEASDHSEEKMLIKNTMPAQSDYKYNLFNMLDEPINTKCSTGLCHKNDIIAPKIKKRW